MKVFDARETDRLRELEGVKPASFQKRAGAFAIDLIFSVLMAVPLFFLYAFFSVTIDLHRSLKINFDFENWYSLSAVLLYFGLATFIGNGRTVGKKIMKIRVVSLTHERISIWQSIERALGYGASMLEFGFIQFFINLNRRTAHDRIAETIVVDDKSEEESKSPADMA